MLNIKQLSYTYANARESSIKNLTLSLPKSAVLGLLGHNGAGKTTLLSILSGLIEADKGTIEINEKSMERGALLKETSLVPQEYAFYDELTVQENLNVFSGFSDCDVAKQKRLIAYAIENCCLEDILSVAVKKLSGGLKRRLNLAIGLLKDTPLLLLDEPTSGIDPSTRVDIQNTILKLHLDGKTIVYTSHMLDEIEKICTHITIINKGKMLLKPTDLASLVSARQLMISVQNKSSKKHVLSVLSSYSIESNSDCDVIVNDVSFTDLSEIVSKLALQQIDIKHITYGKKALERFYLQNMEY